MYVYSYVSDFDYQNPQPKSLVYSLLGLPPVCLQIRDVTLNQLVLILRHGKDFSGYLTPLVFLK